jgi:hypothetical protein
MATKKRNRSKKLSDVDLLRRINTLGVKMMKTKSVDEYTRLQGKRSAYQKHLKVRLRAKRKAAKGLSRRKAAAFILDNP